jgi:hypothetical protein
VRYDISTLIVAACIVRAFRIRRDPDRVYPPFSAATEVMLSDPPFPRVDWAGFPEGFPEYLRSLAMRRIVCAN